MKGIIPVAGLMPALVPGMVEAGLVALEEFGTLSFADVIAPAIELADGMALDETRANAIVRSRRFFDLWPTSKAVFLQAGQMPHPGDVFRQPDLARTLRAMVAAEQRALKAGGSRKAAIDAVRDYFYRGEIAHKIDAFSKANGGLLRYEDMAASGLSPKSPPARFIAATRSTNRDSGARARYSWRRLTCSSPMIFRPLAYNTAEYLHKIVETMKLAYADRDTYYGDPAMAKVTGNVLLSKEYAAAQAKGDRAARFARFSSWNHQRTRTARHPSVSEIARTRIDDELMARDTTA